MTDRDATPRIDRLYQDALNHIRAGEDVAANACFHRILTLAPNHAPSRLLRALLSADAGNTGRAFADLDHILNAQPDHTAARLNRGLLHAHAGAFAAAVTDFTQVLEQTPDDASCRAQCARALIELGKPDEAVDCLQAGLSTQPEHAVFHSLMGQALCDLGRLPEALTALQKARELAPESVDTLHALGLLYDDLGRPADAITTYNEAMQHAAPQDRADITLCRGFSRMMLGNFREAWSDFAVRTQTSRNPVMPRHSHLPRWQGDDIGDTPLIIHAEQGFGDSLQFARFIPLANKRTRRIVVEVPAPLVRLFHCLTDVELVTDSAGHITGQQCSLLDLPQVLQLDQEAIAPVTGYLSVTDPITKSWHDRLSGDGVRKIGIVWQGRIEKRRIPHWIRGVPLADLLAALPEDAAIYPFQKDITADDAATLAADQRVQDHTAHITDFADCAAIADAMDCIITIDSAPAHMALALGNPAYILLPYSADWRWMQDANHTPWYPNAQLFRQITPGDWADPLQRLKSSFL